MRREEAFQPNKSETKKTFKESLSLRTKELKHRSNRVLIALTAALLLSGFAGVAEAGMKDFFKGKGREILNTGRRVGIDRTKKEFKYQLDKKILERRLKEKDKEFTRLMRELIKYDEKILMQGLSALQEELSQDLDPKFDDVLTSLEQQRAFATKIIQLDLEIADMEQGVKTEEETGGSIEEKRRERDILLKAYEKSLVEMNTELEQALQNEEKNPLKELLEEQGCGIDTLHTTRDGMTSVEFYATVEPMREHAQGARAEIQELEGQMDQQGKAIREEHKEAGSGALDRTLDIIFR
ncbi:MAG: hypothetical protein ABH833_02485 [Parcubacteria group bacterium]